LKRFGGNELEIREGDPSDYARDFSDYPAKIAFREEQRQRFTKASAKERLRMLGKAMDDMMKLLPPHQTFAQYKEIYGKPLMQDEAKLSETERLRRLAALENATKEPQKVDQKQNQSVFTFDRAIVLLKNTGNLTLIERIIERLDTESQFQLVDSQDVSREVKEIIIDYILRAA